MHLQAYHAPASIAEATDLLAAAGAMALGGGTDLLVQMRSGARAPRAVVDLKRIPGLQEIRLDAGGARIGAAACCAAISAHAGLRALWPGVCEAAGLIGSRQVQGRASLGGNVCNASPAADSVPALAACGARALIASGGGERRVPVEQLARGPGSTLLAPGEFLLAIELDAPAPGAADAYLRLIPRTEMDIAVAGVGASITLDGSGLCTAARLALGAVAPTVLLAGEAAACLVGTRLEATALEACAEAVRAAVRPISDKRGSADYRRHVAGVLARRAVQLAATRAAARR